MSPFEISRLAAGSYTVSRPILFHYLTEQSERDSLVAALFGALQRKALTAEAVRSFSLAQAGVAQSHVADIIQHARLRQAQESNRLPRPR